MQSAWLDKFLKDKNKGDFVIVFLASVNILLLVTLFLVFTPIKKYFPQITPISADTPITRFSLVSPQENSTVSEITPLVTTISNGPKVISAQLSVDESEIQSVFSQETEKLIIFWDTKKVANGQHNITITATDDHGSVSQLYASFTVENKAQDTQKPIR